MDYDDEATCLVKGHLGKFLSSSDAEKRAEDLTLYSGVGGVALALAEFSFAKSDHEGLEIGTEALEQVWQICREKEFMHGFFTGTAGVAAAVSRARGYQNGDRAKLVSQLIETLPDQPFARLDLIDGIAGTLIALTDVYEDSRHPSLKGVISDFAMQIVGCGTPTPKGFVWNMGAPFADAPLLGFAHGIAGVVYGLAKAAQVLDHAQSQLVEVALEGSRYESSHWSASDAEWPDRRAIWAYESKLGEQFRVHGQVTRQSVETFVLEYVARQRNLQRTFVSAWCHGSFGIGLSRLELLRVAEQYTTELENDIDRCLRAAYEAVARNCDALDGSLCHGVLSIAKFLAEYGIMFANQRATSTAKELTSLAFLRSQHELSSEGYSLMLGLGGILHVQSRVVLAERLSSSKPVYSTKTRQSKRPLSRGTVRPQGIFENALIRKSQEWRVSNGTTYRRALAEARYLDSERWKLHGKEMRPLAGFAAELLSGALDIESLSHLIVSASNDMREIEVSFDWNRVFSDGSVVEMEGQLVLVWNHNRVSTFDTKSMPVDLLAAAIAPIAIVDLLATFSQDTVSQALKSGMLRIVSPVQ